MHSFERNQVACASGLITGRLFDIQKFSVHDGPGIRTLVFLKGCPLRCLWCANPEGQELESQLMLQEERCDDCGRCFNRCQTSDPHLPGSAAESRRARLQAAFSREALCLDACPRDALKKTGFEKSVAEVCATVMEDWPFYSNSGGGVTLSGGEPLMQPEFSFSILQECRRLGLHTAMETCGLAPWHTLELLLDHLDLIMFDVKHMDSRQHKEVTGGPNDQILLNLSRTLARAIPIVIRIPLVPGVNATEDNLIATASFLNEHNRRGSLQRVELLPYHRFGLHKYRLLGLPYHLEDTRCPADTFLMEARRIFQSFDFNCTIESM
jgi:glycyl-radical enzyme activating protein